MQHSLEYVVQALDAKKEGKDWRAACPIHAGHALIISKGTKQPWIVHCFAGCNDEDVLKAVLSILDGSARSIVPKKHAPPEKKKLWQTAPWDKWKTLTPEMYARVVEMRSGRAAGYMPKFETLLAFDFRERNGLVGFPVSLPNSFEVDCIRYFKPEPSKSAQYFYDGPNRDSSRLYRSIALPNKTHALTRPEGAKSWVSEITFSHNAVFFLVEGIWDTLALLEQGLDGAGVMSAGQSQIHPDFMQEIQSHSIVLLLLDNDDAGRNGREQLFPQLPRGSSFNVEYPDGLHDFCNLVDRFPDSVKKILSQATVEAVSQKSVVEEHPQTEPKAIKLSPYRELKIKWGNTIVPKPLDFLWPSRIAKGCFTIICGEQDTGKGLITASIVASMTTGKPWLDAPNDNPPSNVLYMSAEDSKETTLVPRFTVAGAAVEKVAFVTETTIRDSEGNTTEGGITSLHADLNAIRDTCKEFDIKLVIVDPIESYLGSNIKMNDATSTRSVLDPLNKFTDETGIALIALAHFNKNEMQKVINRLSGSHAMSAAPRAVWVISRDPENPTTEPRSFLCQKFNDLSDKDKEGFYWVPEGMDYSFPNGQKRNIGVAQFHSHCLQTAEQVIGANRSASKKDEGAEFVKQFLADGQWRLSADLHRASEEAGFKERTFANSISTIRQHLVYDKKANRTYIRLKVQGVEPQPVGGKQTNDEPEEMF
jgi:hypothetical protein